MQLDCEQVVPAVLVLVSLLRGGNDLVRGNTFESASYLSVDLAYQVRVSVFSTYGGTQLCGNGPMALLEPGWLLRACVIRHASQTGASFPAKMWVPGSGLISS